MSFGEGHKVGVEIGEGAESGGRLPESSLMVVNYF